MSDRHVVPAESGWQVEKENAKRPSAKAPTQAEAVTRAVEIVANDGGGNVVVHGADGTVRETRTVAVDDSSAIQAAGATATATARGAQAKTEKAADEVTTTAGAVADDVSTTAKKAAGKARDTAGKSVDTAQDAAGDVADDLADAVNGRTKPATAAKKAAGSVGDAAEKIGDKAAGTGREIADEVAATGRRARAEVASTAREAGDALVDGADRAVEVGDGLGGRLQTASQQAGRTIHSFTERAAHPLDAAARALNPVRIAGRTAGVVIAGALHVGAVVTRTGTRTAQRSARLVTGRK